MKNLKVFLFVLLISVISLSAPTFSACAKDNALASNVSDLRSAVYEGTSEYFSLSASYGFREEPFIQDGIACNRVYKLKIKLKNKQLDPATYYVKLDFSGVEYKTVFSLNATGGYLAEFEIENFDLKEFTVLVSVGDKSESVTLASVVPDNALAFTEALEFLQKNKPELINAYQVDGNFSAEIYARILVKDNHPYWYIGFAKTDTLKAFLIDGFSGEVLAIRSVF